MEPTAESDTYYVRENGELHVHMAKNIASIFGRFKHTKHCDHPSSSDASSKDALPLRDDNIHSLFDLCLNYLSTNVQNIDSLVGFPDVIAEKIFAAVVNRRVLQAFADNDCASVLRIFDKAYCSSLLAELSIKSLAVLDQHVESLSAFCHISKLDVSGCTLGDNHDYLLHIGHLAL